MTNCAVVLLSGAIRMRGRRITEQWCEYCSCTLSAVGCSCSLQTFVLWDCRTKQTKKHLRRTLEVRA
jgi:hypothetical protein